MSRTDRTGPARRRLVTALHALLGLNLVVLGAPSGAHAGLMIGAVATAQPVAGGPNGTTTYSDSGPTSAHASGTDNGSYFEPGTAESRQIASADANVDTSGYPTVRLEGMVSATNIGSSIGNTAAFADMTFSDVLSLRPLTAEALAYQAAHPTPQLQLVVSATASFQSFPLPNAPFSRFGDPSLDTNDPTFHVQSSLTVRENLSGQLATAQLFTDNTTNNSGTDSHTRADIRGWNSASLPPGVENIGGSTFAGDATFSLIFNSTLNGYAYSLETFLSTNAFRAESNVVAEHSVHLDALLFADGTTPESHGFQVVTASGIASPNAVPEPSSLPLIATGLSLVAARAVRRGGRVPSATGSRP